MLRLLVVVRRIVGQALGRPWADVEIIKQCAIETEAYEKAKWAEKEESSEKIVREAGCTIVELTPEAFAEFQAAMTNPSDAAARACMRSTARTIRTSSTRSPRSARRTNL